MPASPFTEYPNRIRVQHLGIDGDWAPLDEISIENASVRSLRHWVYQMLKVEDCTPARQLLEVLNAAFWAQAFEQGGRDARRFGETRLRASAYPLWKDGYEEGFAEMMSVIAQERETRAELLSERSERAD